MTVPRSQQVDQVNGGVYHCISRCVRRAWLCGEDPLSGRSFSHRRAWVEERMLQLSEIFAVELFTYAVMSNHYHLVLAVDPQRARDFSDEEVARRWCALSPSKSDKHLRTRITSLLANPARVSVLRARLGNLSWFMRYLNEHIARRANREDDVTGRFWEGRFQSFALLDDLAALGCMVYVELNPVRARIARYLEALEFTGLARRLRRPGDAPAPLAPLERFGLNLSDYRALVGWTIEQECGRDPAPDPTASAALHCVGHPHPEPERWLGRVHAHRHHFRAYGSLDKLRQRAAELGQRWLRGARPGLAAPD